MKDPAQRGALHLQVILAILAIILVTVFGALSYKQLSTQNKQLNFDLSFSKAQNTKITKELATIKKELEELKSQDQIKRNDTLQEEIKNIETTYKKSVATYENLLDLKVKNPKLDKKYDTQFAQVVSLLADKNFASASATLNTLSSQIKSEQDKLVAATVAIVNTASAPQSNTPPASGYSRQTVQTSAGNFLVDIISADMGSTKIIVDTASDSDCTNDCPVLALGDYVARSGAFAGVNGTYFCPATYPTCAGKTNSFDLLVMNKNKKYINSDNNVYSTNPAAIFGSGWMRFVGAAQQWGRDTGVDGVISNFPLLLSGSNITFGGGSDPKQGSKGGRSFVASKGSTAYIGVVHSATVAESAIALKALGLENALNLDDGGSTALWAGGYKAGPGRALPNAILFVRK